MGVDVDDLKDAFATIARQGAAIASRNAPKLTGRLAADVRGNRAKSKAVITAGRSSIPYAGAINYGWRAHNIAPSGFMQRADKQLEPSAVLTLEHGIDKAIRRHGLA